MKRGFFSAISSLSLLLVVACLDTSLAAGEPKPASELFPLPFPWVSRLDAADVTRLDFRFSGVRDEDLASLRPPPKLEVLDLTGTQVSDAGLVNLRTLTHLNKVFLDNTRVSDAGLEHLKPLTWLHEINLHNTKVTDAGVAALKKHLPKCYIFYK